MISHSNNKQIEPSLLGKRIIVFFGSLELGGAERQGLLLARHLKNHYGADVQVWGFNNPGKSASICEELDVKWHIAPAPFTGNRIQRWLRLFKFVLLLRRNKPDVLLPYTMYPNVCCGIAWKWTKAKTCLWNQRDEGIERFQPSLEHWAIRNTPYFLSNSKKGAAFLIQSLHVNPKVVRIIPNGVELAPPEMSRKEWREKLNLCDSFIVCMIANFSRFKDHDTLLNAWKTVLTVSNVVEKGPALLLAGNVDTMANSIKELIRRFALENSVHLLGHVKDISGLLKASDLGVLSSRSEGCPNGILECMSAGLPVVATDTPGIRDVVGIDNYPYLAAIGNDKELAEKIVEMSLNPGLRESVGLKNKERALNEFNPERMCKEMTDLIFGQVG